MKNHLLAAVAAAAILVPALAAGSATAESDHDDMSRWHRKMMKEWMGERGAKRDGRGAMRRFMIVDLNDDGRISDDEAASQREMVFFFMDANVNGELTAEEFTNMRKGRDKKANEERWKARQKSQLSRFAAIDTDKSGRVSQAEFMAEGKSRFAAADTDADGKVTPWEFRSVQRP